MKRNNVNDDSGAYDSDNQSLDPNLSISPPQKKQCLVMPSKPDNEGSHGTDPYLGAGETKIEPLGVVQDQMTEETLSDETSSEETYSDSESDNEKGLHGSMPDTMNKETDYESDDDNQTALDTFVEDRHFRGFERPRGNRKIYVICLKKRIHSEEECLEYLDKIGLQNSESHYLGGSRGSPDWFYATLTDDEAAELAREEGVTSLHWDFCYGW